MNKIITVNKVSFSSYKEFCDYFGLDYKAFYEYKINNPSINEISLLDHFFDNVAFKMSDGSYVVGKLKN